MTKIIVDKRTQYTIIPNATLRDSNLSLEAIGLLAYLLSHSDSFEVSLESLKARFKIGRDSMRGLLKELREAGYLRFKAKQTQDGTFAGQEWLLTETPCDGSTVLLKTRSTVNQEYNKKEQLNKKEQKDKENSLSTREAKPSDFDSPKPLPNQPAFPTQLTDNGKEQAYREGSEVAAGGERPAPVEIYLAEMTRLNGQVNIHTQTVIAGSGITDLECWRETCRAWELNQYSLKNLNGLIERYKANVQRKQEKEKREKARSSPPVPQLPQFTTIEDFSKKWGLV